ncbi:MAG: hypothetical protein LQ344_000351 [Seirophora lacunosa]|nr:MAG: hypothetical protein LQ344_000351 [Seirophora lacunosa]
MTARKASHAGSWYTDDGPTLSRQLQSWLDRVPNPIDGVGEIPKPGARVIIAPKRIFLLGPSHHLYLPNCALPPASTTKYATPLGPLALDTTTLSSLRATTQFSPLPLPADEAEHSLEMHLPYIAHLLSLSSSSPETPPPLLTPILVGSTSPSAERAYGALLAPYLRDEANVFIVSSDFCHWGLRFDYTYYLPSSSPSAEGGISLSAKQYKHRPPTDPPIHASIAKVDRMCMDAVESGRHDAFLDVLKRTGNTVCGRHPIGVVMAAMEALAGEGRFRFVRYERSGEVQGVGESSVSYASAFAVV